MSSSSSLLSTLTRSPTSSTSSSPTPAPTTPHLDFEHLEPTTDLMLCPARIVHDLSPLSPLSPLPLPITAPHTRCAFTLSAASPVSPRTAKRPRPVLEPLVVDVPSLRSPKRPRSARMRPPSPIVMDDYDDQPLSAATITPALLDSIEHVKLGADSPPPVDSTRRTSSPPSLPPTMSLKRSNPKGLSLTLSLGATSFHNTTEISTTPTPTISSPGSPRIPLSGETPFTPGPPRTPSASGSIGRAPAYKQGRRPSLLSLITHPPGAEEPVPPTPSGASFPYGRSRGHTRMRSAGTLTPSSFHTEFDPRTSQSAYPTLRAGFPAIDERSSSVSNPGMSPSTSLTSSSSNIDSITSTPSTSPPLNDNDNYGQSLEPYADGPRELIPGVWLGAEDSPWYWDVWARGNDKVATVNVAQEIENPFEENANREAIASGWTSHKGKASVAITTHPAEKDQPQMEYAHLRWSHGEGGLSEVPSSATISQLIHPDSPSADSTQWRFWEAVRWIELRRREGTPVIIHCQCGVSRSATLAVAYVMSLAAAGLVPERLGHLRTMQDAYDFVKGRSPWIGPNVSLVFQLVEYARNLSSMLSTHVARGGRHIDTQWPALVDIETEDAWAQRRMEFDDSEVHSEARALDEAMQRRVAGR